MAPEKKVVGHVQFRCGLGPFLNFLQSVKKDMKPEHRDLLRETPFWKLFKAYDDGLVTDHACKKIYIDIIRIIECFNVETKDFQIRGMCEQLTAVDMEDIFGLPNIGEEIPIKRRMSKPESEFVARNFNFIGRVSRQNVEALLFDKVKGQTKQDQEDFVCLICLYLCITILLCNSGNTIGWNFVTRCESIKKLRKYNWAKATSEFLVNQLVKDSNRPGSVNGCVISLLFWVCEKIPLINTISGREGIEPKFIKWNLQELHAAMSGIGFGTIKEVPNTPIAETRLLTMNTGDAIDKENICPNDQHFESLKKLNSRKSFMKLSPPNSVPKDVEDEIHSTISLGNKRTNYHVQVPDTEHTPKEFDPCKMFQLFSSQDTIFNDDDENCKLGEQARIGEQNIEDKLKECEELLEKERLNAKALRDEITVLQRECKKNEDLKEEIKMLKLKLEIEEVKVIEYHEMLCEAQNCLKESTDHRMVVENRLQEYAASFEKNNGSSLNFTTPPPTLGTSNLKCNGELNSWVIRLKRRKRRVKRMSEFVYFDGKKIKNSKTQNVIGRQPNIVEARRIEISKTTTNAPDDVYKANGRHSSGKVIDPSCMTVWMCLSECERNLLHQYLLVTDSGIPLWKGTSSAIFKEDVKELLTEAAISCNIVDSFGEIMQSEINSLQEIKMKAHIMSTQSWESVKKGDPGDMIKFLYDPLLEVLGSVDYILYPMRHENEFHFTLLVLQKSKEEWLHYNSKREGKEAFKDPCYVEAKKMCDAVTSFLQYNGCVASSILQNGYRMRHEVQSFLTRGESKTFEWLKDIDPCFPLWPSTNCPQQRQYTNDCGVAVMYYMSSILKEQPMMCQFLVNALKEMRGKILSKFLNSNKCWNEDSMEYLHN